MLTEWLHKVFFKKISTLWKDNMKLQEILPNGGYHGILIIRKTQNINRITEL